MRGSYDVGLQSGVRRQSSLSDCLDLLGTVGLDRVEVHPEHVGLAADPATAEAHDGAPTEREDASITAAERALATADVTVAGYGVVRVTDAGEARDHLAVADRLGADYVTVTYPQADDALTRSLIGLGREFGVDVAVHTASSIRHADGARVEPSIEGVLSTLDRHECDRLRYCLDVGHFRVDDVSPERVLRTVGDRIAAVHLRDTSDLGLADVPGAGRLDLDWLVAMLDGYAPHRPPLLIEHDLPAPEADAAAALREAVVSVRTALLE